MTLEIIQRVKDGKKIELSYSFLTDKMNKLLSKYLNKKIVKRKLENQIKEKSDELNDAEEANTDTSAIEKDLTSLKNKYELVRYMRLTSTERRKMTDIRNKIKTETSRVKKEQEELSEIQTLFDILGLNI